MQFLHLLRQYPFIRVIIPFSGGVLAGNRFIFSETLVIFVLLFLIGTLVFIHFHNTAFGSRWLFGVFLNLAFITSGVAFANIYLQKNLDDVKYGNTLTVFQAEVIRSPVEKEKSVGAMLRITCMMSDSVIKDRFRVMAYFEKDNHSKKLRVGDIIVARVFLKEIAGPTNPYEFNYKKRMQWKNVCLTTYIKSCYWEKTDFRNSILSMATGIRENIFALYSKCGIKGDELAVLSALTLGYKDQLSDEITQYYAASGAMHILAVSGLHVGIIYILASRLLFFLRKTRWGKIPCTVIILFILWSFAAIAGFSPSVSRAAFMFSVIQTGKTLRKPPDIYNNIAFSAFVLLLINPFQISDVGFQLSYMAVTGIVFFQPRIYNLLYIRNRAADYLWQLISVSLAAQLVTAPISIYYFHYFPTLFWLTSIFVIPLAAIIIYGAVFLIFMYYLQLPFLFLGKILNIILKVQNLLIFKIQNISFALIENIDLSVFQVVLYFIILCSFTLYLIRKKGSWLIFALSFSAVFMLLHTLHVMKIEDQRQIVVFNIGVNTAVSLVDGRNALFISDYEPIEDLAENFRIKNFIVKSGIRKIENYRITDENKRLYYKHISILKAKNSIFFTNGRYNGVLIYKNTYNEILPSVPLKINCIVLANNAAIDPILLKEQYDADWLVIDPSNSKQNRARWLFSVNDTLYRVHSVADAGAFKLNVN
ncbi:MAG: ComEC/Rec2 family competence protein [Bacteroidales bacterium]